MTVLRGVLDEGGSELAVLLWWHSAVSMIPYAMKRVALTDMPDINSEETSEALSALALIQGSFAFGKRRAKYSGWLPFLVSELPNDLETWAALVRAYRILGECIWWLRSPTRHICPRGLELEYLLYQSVTTRTLGARYVPASNNPVLQSGEAWLSIQTTDSLLPQYGAIEHKQEEARSPRSLTQTGYANLQASESANSSILHTCAAYPGSIGHIDTYFDAQKLVLNISLCSDCCGHVFVEYGNNVIEAGNPQYGDAYFELNYIKVYSLEGASLLSSSSHNYLSPSSAISTGAALTSAPSTVVASATA
ncbi:glycoside hydrolase family 16 protein [Athelia psychrophila]|uniref:Glycoside hydrolase family 16 protein n=1 Tax=Athelia psychrophila TaxID=1759441 RepID=A0A166D8W0_9AGAM|nr:glycoside hydrolase family 16 protein [Fibularhizoctonia sp. CBS 109695]